MKQNKESWTEQNKREIQNGKRILEQIREQERKKYEEQFRNKNKKIISDRLAKLPTLNYKVN